MRLLREIFQKKLPLPAESLDKKLQRINQRILVTDPGEIPSLFSEISVDSFGNLLLEVPARYSNIKAFFPSMPPNEVQDDWNGRHGTELLTASLAFIKTLVATYTELTGKDLIKARVLDYGCGWGRLIRLLYKYVSYENIYGADPWDRSIDLCKQYGVKANLAVCDYVPQQLPFEQKFDLIYAYSVFTHLSEKTTKTVLSTLRRYMDDNGILVITIRPKEFWSFHRQGKFKQEMYQMHEQTGFAFTPHRRAPINGDITYGDTSISLDYLKENFPQWDLVKPIINQEDPYQTLLFLRPT
jgi:2-polyprenyl-3-methyl-5-hydroxy-6-metoxy-1,4-benzoquinol methylase